jgi:hypothetical protein
MSVPACGGAERWQVLDQARVSAHLSIEALWLLYFAYTGTGGPLEIDAYLNGLMELPAAQHDILEYAVEERLRFVQPDAGNAC